MVEVSGIVRGALAELAAPGRRGRRSGTAGVVAEELRDVAIASVTVRSSAVDEVDAKVLAAYGAGLPRPGRRLEAANASIIWAGPGRWLIAVRGAADSDFEAEIEGQLNGMASVVDVSHAVGLVRLSGERVRDALAKGFIIDLHPRAFGVGQTAITIVAHITVQISQVSDAPIYEIAIPRSLAASFWHWLEVSAAEFGLEIISPTQVHGS